ncbi:MAG TPA: DNA gyrase C-terminal beta-propeller domain-containing protein [Anaerolineaceae bacterium]|nr:DNA gyrase C-terminal beta-propeller domain-containing protein [Anaerolineaceae bacterium]
MSTKVDQISIQGRATQGVRVMELDEGDTVAALTRISADEHFPHLQSGNAKNPQGEQPATEPNQPTSEVEANADYEEESDISEE